MAIITIIAATDVDPCPLLFMGIESDNRDRVPMLS